MSPKNANAEIGQKRSYNVPGTDERLTSVTTFLKAYPKDFLAPWAAKMTAERAVAKFPELVERMWRDGHDDATKWLKAAPWEKRDEAAGHGTDVHAYLEARVTADPDYDYEPATPASTAVEQFLDLYRPEPLHVEAQIASLGHGYAGSLDLIARVYGGTGLIDLKTSSALDASMRLQLAAYRHGEFIFEDERVICPVPEVDFCAVLWIPRDHPEQWQFIEVDAGLNEFLVFLHLQEVYRYHEANSKSIGGELILPQEAA